MYKPIVNIPLRIPSAAKPDKMPLLKRHEPIKPNLRASFIIRMLLGPGVMDVKITYERKAMILIESPSFAKSYWAVFIV